MSRTLIVYYSYGGNTDQIARQLQTELHTDLARIETVAPYPADYDSVVRQGQDEVESGYLPLIKPLEMDFEAYGVILVGTPVWWYTMAPAVRTFLKTRNLGGKTVIPFATNAGWLGHTLRDIATLCPDSQVVLEKSIKFSGTRLLTPEKELQAWYQQISAISDGSWEKSQ